jgi:phospholipid/cholesterol/gamma-HCH transport system ATP-binding protein
MIKVKNIHKSFGSKTVLENISFDVRDGETLVILGPSGTGKSILLKTIVGLIAPDSGSIFIDDIDITKCSNRDLRKARQKMGYVFQEAALFDSLTIYDNVAFGLRTLTEMSEEQIKERVLDCLDMVGLKGTHMLKPAAVSGGMKKRAAVARAIAYSPQFLFYDEPTTGLDPIMTDVISDLIIELSEKEKITSIVVTHDMKSAFKTADRIIMLHKCNLVFLGTAQQIKETQDETVRLFIEGSSKGYSEIYE